MAGDEDKAEGRTVGLPATVDAGIHIPREVAEAEGLPEDLDANIVGPYRFPDPRRRRISAWMYLAAGLALGLLSGTNAVFLVTATLLILIAAWHLLAAWKLGIEQEEVLERAAGAVPFAVGHASAAITFHGWRSRPRWSVIVYSADEPPTQRALVEFDAVTGERTSDAYVEAVPNA
jgi:hypothetical protein